MGIFCGEIMVCVFDDVMLSKCNFLVQELHTMMKVKGIITSLLISYHVKQERNKGHSVLPSVVMTFIINMLNYF